MKNEYSIINVPVISCQVEAKKIDYKNHIFVKKSMIFNNVEDYCYYFTHEVNNKKNKNGRINLDIEDGKVISNSVSTYSKHFWENIEEGIKPVIQALSKKKYLTYSSCEGHGMDFRRYVGLAFADEESRDYVYNKINQLNLIGVKLNKLNTVSNMKAVINKNELPELKKYDENELIDNTFEVLNFNIQFHRNYENYYFLEIEIFKAISYNYEGFFNEIKKVFFRLIKNHYTKKNTIKITELINSKDFSKYKF